MQSFPGKRKDLPPLEQNIRCKYSAQEGLPLKKVILVIVTFVTMTLTQSALAQTILYIPADNRPASFDYVVDTAKAAGMNVITPPSDLVSTRTNFSDPDRLWTWLLQNCTKADALVVSSDSLLYGGLVASRTHQFPEQALENRLANFEKIKQINPSVQLYVYGTIMRTPRASAGGTEPPYYEKYGPAIFLTTALQDKKDMGIITADETTKLDSLLTSLPDSVKQDWFSRRAKNYKINEGLIADTQNSTFDYFILGRDDCSPFSRSHYESRHLAELTNKLPVYKFTTFPGADQLGMLMVTRAINNLTFNMPFVVVHYAPGAGGRTVPTYEDTAIERTITAQIIAAGGIVLYKPLHTDLVLAVDTPENGVTLEASSPVNKQTIKPATIAFVDDVARSLDANQHVSLAAIAFSNGADNALMHELARRNMLTRLDAFSGWNTACNTLGYAIGQGMLAPAMTPDAKNRLLTLRLLDDWAYQSNIRAEVSKILWAHGGDYTHLNALAPLLTSETDKRMRAFAEQNFTGISPKNFRVSFPWNRMFEAKPEVD